MVEMSSYGKSVIIAIASVMAVELSLKIEVSEDEDVGGCVNDSRWLTVAGR